MSVELGKLVSKRELSLDELSNKVVAIDAYNVLYQFLTTIRQADGTLLTDSSGNITSHLSGLFYRTIDLIGHSAKPLYVFDGIPSVLKQKALEARMRRREEARASWEEAKRMGETEKAKQFASVSTTVNKDIVRSAKELLDRMGIYYISAPSEGEAQASVMCKQGLVDMVISQDYDTLLLGAPLIARNVTISGKRKLPGKNIYVDVKPELVSLKDTFNKLGLNQEQLIWIGVMLGTDFNDGIKGIGPKTALKIAKGSRSIKEIEGYIKTKYNAEFELDITEVIRLFEKPEVERIRAKDLKDGLARKPDKESIMEFMCDVHGFSKDRIEKYADRLVAARGSARQKGIDEWFSSK